MVEENKKEETSVKIIPGMKDYHDTVTISAPSNIWKFLNRKKGDFWNDGWDSISNLLSDNQRLKKRGLPPELSLASKYETKFWVVWLTIMWIRKSDYQSWKGERGKNCVVLVWFLVWRIPDWLAVEEVLNAPWQPNKQKITTLVLACRWTNTTHRALATGRVHDCIRQSGNEVRSKWFESVLVFLRLRCVLLKLAMPPA